MVPTALIDFHRQVKISQKAMTELNAHDDEHNSQLKKWFDKKKIIVLGLLIVTLRRWVPLIGGFSKYNRVSTGDAYAKADSSQVSGRVPGTVLRVPVDNDDSVRVGQTLVELDPAVYKTSRQEARARLAQAEADVQALEVSVSQTDIRTTAQVKVAEATLKATNAANDKRLAKMHQLSELASKRAAALATFTLAQKDLKRYKQLFRDGAVAAQRWDEVRAKFKQTQAALDEVDAGISTKNASLEGIEQEIKEAEAQLKSVRADLYKNDIQRYRLASLKAQHDIYQAKLDAATKPFLLYDCGAHGRRPGDGGL
jgi:membrane fusion protein (multidrug efflux system)